MKHTAQWIVFVALLIAVPTTATAHCQVPCGIYDDHARIHGMLEDVTTITKAVKKINDLADKSDAVSQNQRVRWINTKELHASRIISVVAEYFLTQKIKPPIAKGNKFYTRYIAQLVACHAVMRASMKSKQTVDISAAQALEAAVRGLGKFYPPAK